MGKSSLMLMFTERHFGEAYDVTRRESFDHLGRWLQEARQNAANPDLVLMLVGNKADLESKRQISRAEGKAFADLHGMLFVELSAKNEKLVESVFVESAQRGLNVALSQPSRRNTDYMGDCGCG